jgi:hypothetical protein
MTGRKKGTNTHQSITKGKAKEARDRTMEIYVTAIDRPIPAPHVTATPEKGTIAKIRISFCYSMT